MDDSSSENALNAASGHLPGIRTARLQVEAAQVRQMELVADGRLAQASDDEGRALTDITFQGYTVIREIHRGGQGIVYQALQQSTNRKVAIKVLLEGKYASKSARQRFDREIE